MQNSLIEKLEQDPEIEIKYNQPLKKYTSFKIGGPTKIFIIPKTVKALQKTLPYFEPQETFILGAGSNIIVSDQGISKVVIYTGQLNNITIKDKLVSAQSGAALIEVSKQAANSSLTGLEFASGIPGSIGGALYMNAGAYGGEIKDIIKQAEFINYAGQKIVLNKKELKLSYRDSILQHKPLVATKVSFSLDDGNLNNIKAKIAELTDKRWSKQPMDSPSAGSMFKRKSGHYPGALIEKAGLKGCQVNGAKVSSKHAGFIVNHNNAQAKDVKKLVKKIQTTVYNKFSIKLETEPNFID